MSSSYNHTEKLQTNLRLIWVPIKLLLFQSKLLPVLIHSLPCFPLVFDSIHRMSDEEAAFGNESPIVDGLEDFPEPPKQKGKGGKTKEVNNARGIPEAIRIRMGYDTPPEETFHDRKMRLQRIRRYWAVRWYKFKSIPSWKWAMQFAFSPPYQYTTVMCTQYTEANRMKYYPKPPAVPHPNTLKTPDDYPEEQERLAIAAEKRRIREEKKAKALAAAGLDEAEQSKPKKRRKLRKLNVSPPPATDEEAEHEADDEADAAAQLEDSIDEDPTDEADDESEHSPIPQILKKKLIKKSLKKAGAKPSAPKGIKIQDPSEPPAPKKNINLTNLVVEAPLASKPPRRLVPAEQRTKERHDPKAKPVAEPAAVPEAKAPEQAKTSKPK